MANPDRPMGFVPTGTLSGAPWTAAVRRYPLADRSSDTTNNHGDIYVGDPVKLSSGSIAAANSGDAVVGVFVGYGTTEAGPFDPDNLSRRYAPLTLSGGYAWVAPADQCVFEIQSDSNLGYAAGSAADFNLVAATAHGSRTTGLSNVELTTASDNDLHVVQIQLGVDNDSTLANTRYLVRFREIAFAQAAT